MDIVCFWQTAIMDKYGGRRKRADSLLDGVAVVLAFLATLLRIYDVQT